MIITRLFETGEYLPINNFGEAEAMFNSQLSGKQFILKLLLASCFAIVINQASFADALPPDFLEFKSLNKMVYPWGVSRYGINRNAYKKWYNQYWHEREYAFNRAVEYCQTIVTDAEQNSCYLQLRQSEQAQTNAYEIKYQTDLANFNQRLFIDNIGNNTTYITRPYPYRPFFFNTAANYNYDRNNSHHDNSNHISSNNYRSSSNNSNNSSSNNSRPSEQEKKERDRYGSRVNMR